jgi:hypothetical protein
LSQITSFFTPENHPQKNIFACIAYRTNAHYNNRNKNYNFGIALALYIDKFIDKLKGGGKARQPEMPSARTDEGRKRELGDSRE